MVDVVVVVGETLPTVIQVEPNEVAVSAARSAELYAGQSMVAKDESTVQAGIATAAATSAATAQTGAENARDAAIIGAGVYATEAAGRAAVADGVAFKVQGSGDVAAYEYRRVNSGSSTLIATYPSKAAIDAITAKQNGMLENFTLLTSANIYDPNIADHADDSTYNPSGSVGAVTGYHRSGLIAVTAGQQLVIDMTNCHSDWKIFKPSNLARVMGYTAAPAGGGTFHSLITATFSQSDRFATFTVPSGVNYIAWSAYDTVGSAPTTQDFATMRARAMVYLGTTQIEYAQYYPANSYQVDFVDNTDYPVTLVKSGTDVYIRQPYNATYDLVRKLKYGAAQSASEAGVIDFVGVRKIRIASSAADTALMYEAAQITEYLQASNDNSPPEKLNSMYLGGEHGVAASFRLTKTGHGLTNSAVGDTGTDSASKIWVITKIDDTNNITVTAQNDGASASKWLIRNTITGSTITFAGAGAYTFTTNTAVLFLPLAQNYTSAIYVDGVQVTADGTYSGYRAEVRESYGIPNPARWLTALIAAKPAVTPLLPNDPANATQIEVNASWQFDRYGAQVGYFDHYVVEQYARSGGSTDDYFGAQQWQVSYRNVAAGETVWQYVPDLTGSVGGYDFSNIAEITNNAATVTVAKADCLNTSNPASHFAQIIKDSGGNKLRGFVHGYARNVGVGVPATRAALCVELWQLSTAKKQYIRAVDSGYGATAAAGENLQAVTFNSYYDMSANTNYTVNAMFELADGKVHWVFDCHATLSATWITMPPELVGKLVAVLDSTNFTLHTTAVVTAKGLRVSTSGGRGRAVIQIG